MQIAKWGNSLAVRLPAKLIEQLGLKEGDDIELVANADGSLAVLRQKSADELFEQIKKFQGRLSNSYKFEREEANSRERERD